MTRSKTADKGPAITRDQWLILIALMFGVFLGALDISIVSPALAAIARDLHIAHRDLTWIITLYTLVYVIAVPMMSALSDRLGRRGVFLLSIALFASGSLLALFSQNLLILLVARAIQALGGGGLFPIASTVIGEIFPQKRRGMALGFVGMMWGVAAIIGPLIGGWITEFLGWPYIFSISFLLSFAVFGLAYKVLPRTKPVHARAFDWIGMALLGLGLSLTAFGLNQLKGGAVLSSFFDASTGPWLLGGLAVLVLFVFYERWPSAPIIRTALFSNTQLDIALVLSFARGMTEAGMVFLPYYAMKALGIGPGLAGTLILATAITVFLTTEPAGLLVDKIGARWVLVGGAAIAAIGAALMTTASSLFAFIWIQVVLGIGLSALSGAPIRYVVLAETGTEDRAGAQALVSLMSSFGIMAGSAVAGAFLAGQTLFGFHAIYWMVALTAVLALVVSLFLRAKTHKA